MFMLVLGIIACFMGYSLFRSMLPMWGFLIGGWIAWTLLPGFMPAQANQFIYQAGAFAVGGIIGGIISMPLYFVIIFLSGAGLGMLVGVVVGALIEVGGVSSMAQMTSFTSMAFPPLPQTALQLALMMVFGLILGGVAIGFQKFMVCASSAFLGAAAMITGLTSVINSMQATATGRSAVMMTGWLVLGMIGVFIQYRMMDEV
jgi:hypothetical protein